MKWIFIALIVVACASLAGRSVASDGTLTIEDSFGIEMVLDKAAWPIKFRCNRYGTSDFWFSIRRDASGRKQRTDAWIIFSDYTGEQGELYRQGLDWRFNWTAGGDYSVIIKSGGSGFYYNWAMADENGIMNGSRSAHCTEL